MIATERRVAPHTDPELKRKPQCCARLVRDMSLRGLVSFRAPSEATVGVIETSVSINTFGVDGIACCPHLHPGRAYNSIAYWHLPECRNNSSCQGCPLSCSFVQGESSRSLASPVRRVSAASGSCHGLFLGALFFFVKKWWRVVYGHLVLHRTRCPWIVTGHLR